MKSLKRLISIMLCIGILFSCCLVQAEETETVEAPVYGAENLDLMNVLGIVEYTEENLSQNITRGEFYALLCKTAGYPAVKDTEVIFSDLIPGAEYEEYAKVLYRLGLISYDRDGKIYPASPIPPAEAAALFVKVLGYTPMADAKGGYPAGYLAVASSLDVTEDIDMSVPDLTKGMALDMAVNALEADIMTQSVKANGETEYRVETDLKLFESALGIVVIEGVVNGVDISRVSGFNDVRPFFMEVEGEEIYAELPELHSFLGYEVKAYCVDDRNYGTKALYVEKTNYNKETVISIEDITEFGTTSIKAYEPDSNKAKTYKFKKAVPVVYNGVSTGKAFNESLVEGKLGTVTLLDNDGNNTADVVFVNVYDNVVVSYLDNSAMIAYDKYDNTKKINLDNDADEPYVIIYNAEGEECARNDISVGDVITVYESAPDAYQPYARIYVNKETSEGDIEEINDNNKIVVNGTEYELTDACYANHKNLVTVGASVVLYLDHMGYVAEMTAAAATEFVFGFIVAADTEGALDSKAKFKLYVDKDTFLEAYAANNIRIDGVRYSNTDAALFDNLHAAAVQMYGPAIGDDVRCSVVRYAVNTNGEISAIDTIMHDAKTVATRTSNLTDKNCLFAVKQASAYHRRSGNHSTLGSGVIMSSATLLLNYPDVTDEDVSVFDEDNYNYNKFTSEVPSNKTLSNTWAMYTKEDQIVSTLIAQPFSSKVGGGDDESAYFAIVDRVSVAMDANKDGAAIPCITVVSKNGMVKIPVEKDVEIAGLVAPDGSGNAPAVDPDLVGTLKVTDLKQGDVVKVTTNYKGYLTELALYYRPSSSSVVTTAGYYASVTSIFNWYNGYVYDCYPEGFYFYSSKDLTGDINKDAEILESISMEDCQFVYYTAYTSAICLSYDLSSDNEALRVGTGDYTKLKSYKDTGKDCTYGILQRYYTYPRTFVAIDGLNK